MERAKQFVIKMLYFAIKHAHDGSTTFSPDQRRSDLMSFAKQITMTVRVNTVKVRIRLEASLITNRKKSPLYGENEKHNSHPNRSKLCT